MMRESMCDRCKSPGACCKRLPLSGIFAEPMSRERIEHELIKPEWYPQLLGLFHPGVQDENGVWRFWCTALDQATGRCTVYDSRPALCRSYSPGQDQLCVHHWADPAADLSPNLAVEAAAVEP